MTVRDELGDFSSVVCLKAIMTGMEDILGERATALALTNAGRIRGREVAAGLEREGDEALERLLARFSEALGAAGTRLCIVDAIEREGQELVARTRETVCSYGEPAGSERRCTYTLGVVWGALELLTGTRLRGRHVESVLRGATHDVFRFTEL